MTFIRRRTPQIQATARSPLQHMAGIHMAAVIWDVGCHCCCCIDTTRHVVRFTRKILRKVGLKPFEMLSTNDAVITCCHPCWLQRSEEWWEMNTCVWLWTTSNFFKQDHIWLVHNPLITYNAKNVLHDKSGWFTMSKINNMSYKMRFCHDDAISILIAWPLNRYL